MRRATPAGRFGVSSTARTRWTTWCWKARGAGCRRSGGRPERCSPAAPRSSTGAACRRAPDSTSRRARPVLSSRWLRWTPRRSSIRRCGAAAGSASGLALAACLYGFAGGGLPNIKTVAILPFDNQTPEPALTKEVNDAELFDQRDNKSLWQKQGLTVVGEYPPPQEAAGRKVALQKLVNDLVDGAQSQW